MSDVSLVSLHPDLFRSVEVVAPSQSNHHGTLFGGTALAMVDKFAFVLATRRFRRTIVTASISKTDFHSPVMVGDMAEVSGSIVRQGQRSLDIDVELVAEDLFTGQRRSCLTSRLVMVAVGEEAPPKPEQIIDEYEPGGADEMHAVDVVFPGQANQYGNLHGSAALNWLGRTALVVATRRARQAVVMAASEKVDFLVPVMVGDIVEISAKLQSIGRTSISVESTLYVEKPNAYGRRLCARAHFVFVAVDKEGKPTPVPAA